MERASVGEHIKRKKARHQEKAGLKTCGQLRKFRLFQKCRRAHWIAAPRVIPNCGEYHQEDYWPGCYDPRPLMQTAGERIPHGFALSGPGFDCAWPSMRRWR